MSETAKGFFVGYSTRALRLSVSHGEEAVRQERLSEAYLKRAEVACALASLPEELAMRARLGVALNPLYFRGKA